MRFADERSGKTKKENCMLTTQPGTAPEFLSQVAKFFPKGASISVIMHVVLLQDRSGEYGA